MQIAQHGAFFSHFVDESPGANEFCRLHFELKNLCGALMVVKAGETHKEVVSSALPT